MHMTKSDPEFQFIQGKFAHQIGDISDAKKRLVYAAEKGHARAQQLLGAIFEQERAYRLAAKWYRLAAWQGRLPRAQYCLARLYYFGYGVEADNTKAERWMRAAAEGADVDAMLGLGLMRLNAVEAYAWFRLAAARRSAEASEEARELRLSLTRDQVDEAKALMAALRARVHKPAKRTRQPKGPKHYVGSQRLGGSVCDWRVEYSVQRAGEQQWTLYTKGEEGAREKDGPMYVEQVVEALEERGIDVDTFVADLRRRREPDLNVLAREIEKASAGEREALEA